MTVPSENKSYFRVLYSPDGSHVACGMSRAEVRILDSTTGAQVGGANIALATAQRKRNSNQVICDVTAGAWGKKF